MRKFLLFLFILSLPAYAIETKSDPLSEFSEETLSTYNDKTTAIVRDLNKLEDAIEANIASGIIVMWSGAISTIPSGWVICDGNNSTPNLTDRFVIHADADSGGTNNPDDTGGASTVSLSIANLPAHTHGAEGDHSHTIQKGQNFSTGGDYWTPASAAGSNGNPTGNDGGHTHDSVGSGTAHANRDKYYALAYIMKI